jgi:GTP cyclohydrolase IA
MNTENKPSRVEELVRQLILEMGEDPNREGLLKTPHRVARAWQHFTSGYHKKLEEVINGAIFNEDCSEMVVVKDIEYFSHCEHHMLPFFGHAHVGYIPRGKVIGLSKIPRIIDMFARRMQVQERLTHQVAQALNEVLDPAGVAVIIEGRHMCMQMRGVEKQNSYATTSAMLGEFHDDQETRMEFLSIVGMKKI